MTLFPNQMKEWKKCQEEAAKRDHRKRGRVCTFLNLQTFYILSFFFFNSSYALVLSSN